MAHTPLTLDILDAASRQGGSSAFTATTPLAPAAGPHATVAPARYTSRGGATFVFEDRFFDGVLHTTVLLDSRPSFSNRLEEALSDAIRDGHPVLSKMPSVRVSYARPDGTVDSFTDAQLPARLFDAHIRVGSTGDGPVNEHAAYRAARDASAEHARPIFDLSPVTLVFGAWDASRKSRQVRVPSAVNGEIVGVVSGADGGRAAETRRSGARVDPVGAKVTLPPAAFQALASTQREDLSEKKLAQFAKVKSDTSGSVLGLGAIPPGVETLDGVATSRIIRTFVLSFATLRRLRFDAGPDGDAALRALLAAVALNAAARSEAELYLRANCHLVEAGPTEAVLDRRQGRSERFEPLDIAHADDLLQSAYDLAVERAGIDWNGSVLEVTGNPAVVQGALDDETAE